MCSNNKEINNLICNSYKAFYLRKKLLFSKKLRINRLIRGVVNVFRLKEVWISNFRLVKLDTVRQTLSKI